MYYVWLVAWRLVHGSGIRLAIRPGPTIPTVWTMRTFRLVTVHPDQSCCQGWFVLQFRQFVNELYVKGYALSLLALLISIVIFLGFKYVRAGQVARLAYDADADALSYRSLRCTRIRIHVHLFASLACTCIAWILWYRLVVEHTEQIAENPVSGHSCCSSHYPYTIML